MAKSVRLGIWLLAARIVNPESETPDDVNVQRLVESVESAHDHSPDYDSSQGRRWTLHRPGVSDSGVRRCVPQVPDPKRTDFAISTVLLSPDGKE